MKLTEILLENVPAPFTLKSEVKNGKTYITIKTMEPRGTSMHVIQNLAWGSRVGSSVRPKITKAGVVDMLTLAGFSVSKKIDALGWDRFKPAGVILVFDKPEAEAKAAAEELLADLNRKSEKDKAKQDKWKAGAGERKKEASKYNAEQQKKRKAEMEEKYGKGMYDRVKIKQLGGDDGYQYNVIVDGRSVMNGLSRSEAEHRRIRVLDDLAKKEGKGKHADEHKPVHQRVNR